MKHVCLWSGPRNVSTALMYSFAQRADTVVIDEPLYAHYLRTTGAAHPGRDEVLASSHAHGDAVMRAILDTRHEAQVDVVFIKQMAHHLVDIDHALLREVEHVFLIRDPRQMLPSLTIQLPDATLADTGLATQWALFRELQALGRTPAVLDSRELLLDPAGVLARCCDHLAIPFTPHMLSWPAGARPEDGVWAKYWYDAVHRSTGFDVYRPKSNFPESLQSLFEDCNPYYLDLVAHAIRA